MTPACDPVPVLARAARLVSDPARHVHHAVLAAFATAGQPPAAADLDRLARQRGGDPDRVRAELTAADLLAFTPHGEVRAAYPFSPAPTVIQVSWDGGPSAYAMCAIDALGMSAMLGRPVVISAAEPGTGRRIMVAVDGDRARWAPARAVVFAGATDAADCQAADRSCGYINFFTSGRAARAWARRHAEVTGTVLSRDGALRMGIDEFGTLLRSGNGDASGQAE
jgi:Alkylmercury lyase